MKYSTVAAIKTRVTVFLLAAALGAGVFLLQLNANRSRAEEQTVTAWVICQPGDYVNARERASRKSAAIGIYEAGDAVELDGKCRDGFAHIVDAGLEREDAWIHAGYLVFDEPEWTGERMVVISNARVAARKWADGPVRAWVQPFAEVTVFWMSEEWSVTNRGFIRTEYLEVGALE